MREITFIFPVFIGLLFLVGKNFVIGFEGSEPTVIPFPKNEAVGWAFIWLGVVWCFPPWLVERLVRLIKKVIKRDKYLLDLKAYENSPCS